MYQTVDAGDEHEHRDDVERDRVDQVDQRELEPEQAHVTREEGQPVGLVGEAAVTDTDCRQQLAGDVLVGGGVQGHAEEERHKREVDIL